MPLDPCCCDTLQYKWTHVLRAGCCQHFLEGQEGILSPQWVFLHKADMIVSGYDDANNIRIPARKARHANRLRR